jgi:hypothetical protein
MTVDALLERLQDVRRSQRGWIARCPAHDDRRPSLAIDQGADARILLHDRAGCRTDEILQALGLQFSDLFGHARPDEARRRPPRSALAEARYDALCAARRQPGFREHVQGQYLAADALRLADRVRAAARDTAAADWDQLALAAALTTEAEAMLAEIESA